MARDTVMSSRRINNNGGMRIGGVDWRGKRGGGTEGRKEVEWKGPMLFPVPFAFLLLPLYFTCDCLVLTLFTCFVIVWL